MVTAIIFHLDFSNQMQIVLLKTSGWQAALFFIATNGPKDWALDTKRNTLDFNQ